MRMGQPKHLQNIKKLVKLAKRNRVNRCYSAKCFNVGNLHDAGIAQPESLAAIDSICLKESHNEIVKYFGFGQDGSSFTIDLSIISLYPDVQKPEKESKWRLASLKFVYIDVENGFRYEYRTEQLLDYDYKRSHDKEHDVRNTYKVGSMTIENMLPFSLTRILFNGLMERYNVNDNNAMDVVSMRISLSTHPTADKHDYRYRFCQDYLAQILDQSVSNQSDEIERLVGLVLEDRIDQTFMFQGQIDLFGDYENQSKTELLFWGSKSRRLLNPLDSLSHCKGNKQTVREQVETLNFWCENGHVISLNRPKGSPFLIYGLAHSNFDYTGHIELVLLYSITDGSETLVQLSELASFSQLFDSGYIIKMRSYSKKWYTIEFTDTNKSDKSQPSIVRINNSKGYASLDVIDVNEIVKASQEVLWTINIDGLDLNTKLAKENLLGGKGNSLIELCSLVKSNKLSSQVANCHLLSVPRGLVVSSIAYMIWLQSNQMIEKSIRQLDATRKTLAARSFYTNPLTDEYLTLGESQRILREECKKTCLVLKSCPIPPQLKRHIHSQLSRIFTSEELKYRDHEGNGKLFAVRSSAVGEDSEETSAAGQMRTILDACGFESICNSIVECWSSQFEIEAISYKSQNGLQTNLPMAVVIQELVNCDVAGVAATCDPLTGDKREFQILANVGLGEGVVSGRQTDTVKVKLASLHWDSSTESYMGYLNEKSIPDDHLLISSDSTKESNSCCLSKHQIVSISNLLLQMRKEYDIKDREIEWGITSLNGISSSGSSSSSSASSDDSRFAIHLLQSRPLTHLQKLNSIEIDHELDTGFSSPSEFLSRANLGEVMPGAMCPMYSTYFQEIAATYGSNKPFCEDHTRKTYSSGSFAFHGLTAFMVLSHTDYISRFFQQEKEGGVRKDILDSMIGFQFEKYIGSSEQVNRFLEDRMNPVTVARRIDMPFIALMDSKVAEVILRYKTGRSQRLPLHEDLLPVKGQIEIIEKPRIPEAKDKRKELAVNQLDKDINQLHDRLTNSISVMATFWVNHIISTILSMTYNTIAMKILSDQPNRPEYRDVNHILGDFSILFRGRDDRDKCDKATEGTDMTQLLANLIVSLSAEGQIESVKMMSNRQLYDYLMKSEAQSGKLFRKFLEKNGHRAYKEFDFSTLTWADDPTYIIKSLNLRLKAYGRDEATKDHGDAEGRAKEQEIKYDEVLAKIEKSRMILTKLVLPRARQAVVKRERSKSSLIRLVDKYRKALRHLAALLCLKGHLPSCDLIYWFAFEELELVIRGFDLPRLLYKARRRQHRAKALSRVSFAEPTFRFIDAFNMMRSQAIDKQVLIGETKAVEANSGTSIERLEVRGMTSCGGFVTGRACVVSSIDDMDHIEPNDILITYSIDVSWSVYFFTLAGIVTEVGGIVSHGAVVAREYGIPTLCTAVGACSKFKTGDIVTLDADSGVCYLDTNK